VPTETDLRSVTEDVLSSVKTPPSIDVSISFEEDFPVLMIDANLMRRVFTNLITNAVQAMFESGQLTVRGHVTDMYAFVDIEDTGEGISEENMEKIFRPLFTTKAKGTGLGLSVCERIVESHGGDILVESEVGVGSTFTVRLPLANDMDGVELQTMPMKVNEIAEASQPL
jgi:signal transduction histidine kinase